MSRWKDQINALSSNALDFAQRISSELTAETETDPSAELQYYKDQAIKFERDLVKCQSDLLEKNKEIEVLTESAREAFEEVEVTRQTLLNRIAAKELELEKVHHQIEQLRDFQNDSTIKGSADEHLALELDIARAEKANLSKELTVLNNKVQYYQAQLAAKSKPASESEAQPQELKSLQEELTKSNDRVETLRQEMSTLLAKNHLLLNECTERQEICQKLEHQLTAIQSLNVSTHSSEVEKLCTKISQLKEENAQIRKNLSDVTAVNESLTKKLGDTGNYNADVSKLDAEIDRLVSLSQNSQKLHDIVEQLKLENAELSAQVAVKSVAHDESRDLQKLIARLLSNVGIELPAMESDVNSLLNLLEHKFNELSTLLETKDQQVEDYEFRLQTLMDETAFTKEKIKSDADSQCSFNNSSEQELIKAKQCIQELESEIQASRKFVDDASKQNERYESSVVESKQQLKELEAEISRFQELISQTNTTENTDNQQTLLKARERICELEAEVANYKATIHRSDMVEVKDQVELQELQQQVAELNSVIENYQKLIRDADASKNEDKTLIDKLNLSVKELEGDVERLSQEHATAVQTVESLQIKNEQLKTALIESESSLNEIIVEHKAQTDKSAEEILNANCRIKELESEILMNEELIQKSELTKNADKSTFDELNLSIIQFKREIDTLRFENSNYGHNIQSLRDENDLLRTALTESESSLNEMMTERKNLVEGNAEAEIYRRYAQDRIERKQQELDETLAKVRKKEDEIDYYRTSLEKQQIENEKLQKRISGINATIKDLQSTYAESQSQLRTTEKSMTQNHCELKEFIEKLQSEKAVVEQEHASTVEKLKNLESQVLDLQAEVELLEERCQNDTTRKKSSSSLSASNSIASFVMPPELRQFILSAITCNEEKRADGALLLASFIGCTAEEKLKVEQSFKPSGWSSLFRGSQSAAAHQPQNTREFLTQFVDFLERESSLSTSAAANVQKTDPVRLDCDIKLQPQKSSSDLNNIIG